MDLITSGMNALLARRSCANSLGIVTQSCLFRAQSKPGGPEGCFRSSLGFGTHAFSCPPFYPQSGVCGQEEVSDDPTFMKYLCVAKLGELSLDELRRHTKVVETAPLFDTRYVIPEPQVLNAVDSAIVKNFQHPFIGHSHSPSQP